MLTPCLMNYGPATTWPPHGWHGLLGPLLRHLTRPHTQPRMMLIRFSDVFLLITWEYCHGDNDSIWVECRGWAHPAGGVWCGCFPGRHKAGSRGEAWSAGYTHTCCSCWCLSRTPQHHKPQESPTFPPGWLHQLQAVWKVVQQGLNFLKFKKKLSMSIFRKLMSDCVTLNNTTSYITWL